MKTKVIPVVVIAVAVAAAIAIAVWFVAGIPILGTRQEGPNNNKDNIGGQGSQQRDSGEQEENRRAEVLRLASEAKGKEVARLLPYLEDGSPRVRLAAAREIIQRDAVGNLNELKKLLRDEDGIIRASVAQLLGKTKDPRLIDGYAWIIQYDEEDRVKLAALDGLKEIGQELCIPPMIEALKDESPVVRKHATTRLPEVAHHKIDGTLHSGNKAHQKWLSWWKEGGLRKYVNHEGLEKLRACNDVSSILMIAESRDLASPDVRATAVSVLSTMPGARATEAFRRCLHSSDEVVCIAAINAVAVRKLTNYIEEIADLAKNSKSEAARVKATQVLSELSKGESAKE